MLASMLLSNAHDVWMLLIKICRKFVCPPAVLGLSFNASIRNFSAEHCMGSCREILVDFAGCNVTKIVVGCSSKEVQVCCYCLDCKQPTKSSQHFVHQRESSTEPWSTREHLITLGTSDSVLPAASLASQQYFSLTSNQHHPVVIFSHNKSAPAAASRTECGREETSGFLSKKQWHLGRCCRRSKLRCSAGADLWPVGSRSYLLFMFKLVFLEFVTSD